MNRRRLVLGLPLLPLLRHGPAASQAPALAGPSGPPVLSIGGRIRVRNLGDLAAFDAAQLEALPQVHIVTRTPWYAEPRKFTGPLLRDLLTLTGADGRTARAVALNDYRVDIPIDDVRGYDVIVARLLDDRPMSVRDKGPLFVMYPFDSRPELRTAVYYSRCIWQLRSIEVLA